MEAEWDLAIVDAQFNPHGYSMVLRLREEKKLPYILIQTCGSMAAYSADNLGLGTHIISLC